jgi:hypothetical protein
METARASIGSTSKISGQVWIWVEESIPSLEESIVPLKLIIVNELLDASILDATGAEQVTRKANEEYSKYLWQPVPTRDPGKFVVRGELRPDPSRHLDS